MTQTEYLLDLFRRNGGELTLGQILAEKGHGIGSNETGRISDARKALLKEGKTIVGYKGRIPTERVYRIQAIEIPAVVEPNGQRCFV